MLRRYLFPTVFLSAFLLMLAPAAGGELDWPHMPDQLLVKFQPGTEDEAIQVVNGLVQAEVAGTFRLDPDLRLVRVPRGSDLADALSVYRAQPEVRYAEPNYIYQTQLVPNDPRFGELWGMHNTGQSGGLYDFDIDGPEAWDEHTDAGAVIIGSIDTGIDMDHEDLPGMWTNPGETPGNGVDDDGNGYIDDVNGWDFVNNDNNPYDDHNHGTHTMGSATGVGDNGKGVAGVTWSSQIMAIKVCNLYGSCPGDAIVNGVDYGTENGAHVTSNSYGGGGYSQAMYDAINRAHAAGVLFSAAAGNNGRNTDASPFYPASYDLDNIISVAAMNRYGSKASFSNYGATTVDLGAPGEAILSTIPGDRYGNMSGTSMACPHVTGAVAYIMGFNPTLGHLEYKQIIMDSAVPNADMQGRCVTNGVLNIREALTLTPPLNVPPENDPPVADANGPYKGRAWKPITFDGSASWDPDEQELDDYVASYTWDWGDGTKTTTSSPTVTHAYPFGNAEYVVTLTVRDKYRVQSEPTTSTCRITGGGKKAK